MRALLIRLLGLRTFVVGAAVMVFATAASAGTLTVFTTDLGGVPKDTFVVGETFLLKVTGDGQGNTSEDSILGELVWDGTLTTTLVDPPGCSGSPDNPCTTLTQGRWLQVVGSMCCGLGFPSVDGNVFAFNQVNTPVVNQVATSTITLLADAIGSTEVTWGGSFLDFFGVYFYGSSGGIPTGHSFTITPEPAAAAPIALGLLGLAGWRRVRD